MDAQNQQPAMNGDDDLAKTLGDGLQFEETPMPGNDGGSAPTMSSLPGVASIDGPSTVPDTAPPDDDVNDEPAPVHHTGHSKAHDDDKASKKDGGELEKIKASALEELRPLVGKLNLPAEEKFDTLLLIIRSTDDQSLLDEAHAAAKAIEDDTKRAQALLDVIKEIDYFSTKR